MAPEKTEVVLIVAFRAATELEVVVDGTIIRTKKSVKYLEILIGRNNDLDPQIDRAAEKGTACSITLVKLMPLKYGTDHRSRRAIAMAGLSAVLYAAPVWARAMNFAKHRDRLRSKCRALLIIAGIPPLHIQVIERSLVATGTLKEDVRRRTLESWQSIKKKFKIPHSKR